MRQVLDSGGFDAFVGNMPGVAVLRMAVGAANKNHRAAPHVLLTGGPGLGKTTLARIIAKEVGATMKDVVGGNLSKPENISQTIAGLGYKGILFVDEIHMIPAPMQDYLLTAMAEYKVPYRLGLLCVPQFTVIGATTDPEKLNAPLIDRFKYAVNLFPYSEAEIYEIIQQNKTIPIDDEAAHILATVCKNSARVAVNLIGTKLPDYCSAIGVDKITVETVIEMMALNGIYPLGLTTSDLHYLELLDTVPQSLATMKAKFNGPMVEDIERFLLRLGFMEKASQGRTITQKGEQYLSKVGRLYG